MGFKVPDILCQHGVSLMQIEADLVGDACIDQLKGIPRGAPNLARRRVFQRLQGQISGFSDRKYGTK